MGIMFFLFNEPHVGCCFSFNYENLSPLTVILKENLMKISKFNEKQKIRKEKKITKLNILI